MDENTMTLIILLAMIGVIPLCLVGFGIAAWISGRRERVHELARREQDRLDAAQLNSDRLTLQVHGLDPELARSAKETRSAGEPEDEPEDEDGVGEVPAHD